MRFSESNILYGLKQLVPGKNGDDTPVAGTLLPGNNASGVNSSAQSADGGIKVDKPVPLSSVVNPADFPTITDNSGGTASATFALMTGSDTVSVTAIQNAFAQVALQLNLLHRNFATSVSSMPALTTPASGTVIGTFSFAVPRDYDEASDHLAIILEASTANADSSITITGTATVAPIASQLTTSTAIVATTKTAVTATAPFSTSSLAVTREVQVFAINLSGYGLLRNDLVSVALAFVGTLTGNGYVWSVIRHYDSTIVSYNETDATDNPSTSGITGVSASILPGFGNPLR